MYSSSSFASTQAQSSTPVPPSFAPPQGLAPHLSASQRPKLNLRCNSLVFACCKIWPRLLGKYLKSWALKAWRLVLLWKLKLASRWEGGSGRKNSCSLYSEAAETHARRWLNARSTDSIRCISKAGSHSHCRVGETKGRQWEKLWLRQVKVRSLGR